jgi:hypothetical protein
MTSFTVGWWSCVWSRARTLELLGAFTSINERPLLAEERTILKAVSNTAAACPYLGSAAFKRCFETRYDNNSGLGAPLLAYGLDNISNASTISSIIFRIFTKKGTRNTTWGSVPEYGIYAEFQVQDFSGEIFMATNNDDNVTHL